MPWSPDNNQSFSPSKKYPGDLVLSEDWNAAMEEIVDLNSNVDDLNSKKVNRSGTETLGGPLSVTNGLTAKGGLRLGSTGTPLSRLVAGRVNQNGDIVDGSGFTCVRMKTGQYSLTFEPAFSSPAVVVANTPDPKHHISASSQKNTSVTISIFDASAGSLNKPVFAPFNFIAVDIA